MTSPFEYKDLAEIMGSWPISVRRDPDLQQLQPSSLYQRATLVGTRREPSDGYLVGGLSMTVYADVGGTPTAHTVTFPAGAGGGLTTDHFTLAEVIARIQASVPPLPANTAQNSDNFLLLQSQTSGDDSYLRLESIPGAEGVFHELGLQPEVTIRGGSIRAAQHVDPTRQVAGVNQQAMVHGESFTADVVNRGLLQLSVNAGVARNQAALRRVAVRKEEPFAGSGAAGVQLNTGSPTEAVFTGAVGSPSYDQLKEVAVVLDEHGGEFTKEMESAGAALVGGVDFAYNAESGEQVVTFSNNPFLATDPDGNWYVIATNLAVATALNDIPLKIIRYIGPGSVVVDPVDPATGSRLQVAEVGRTGRRSQIFNVACEIEGFYADAGFATPIEQQKIGVTGGGGSVTRVETANRIFVSTANFLTDTKVGDLVEWTGAAGTTPFSNNGDYLVSKVVDDKRIELTALDGTPVFLNPSIGVGLGTVAVKSDGNFARQPYVKFAEANLTNFNAGRGAIPAAGDNFRIAYKVAKTVSDVAGDPTRFSNDPRADLTSSAEVQSALLRILGPSASKYTDRLFSKEMLNLDFLSREHHINGRHSTIRPDVVDMYPGVTGTTVTVRGNSVSDAVTVPKFKVREEVGSLDLYGINRQGRVNIGAISFLAEDEVATGGSPEVADLRVYNAGSANALVTGARSAYALRSRVVDTGGVNSSDHGVGSLRFHWDDDVVANPRVFSIAHSNDALRSFLRMNVVNDGAGNAVRNAFVLGVDGFVGVHMGATGYPNAEDIGASAPLHVRGNNAGGIEELLRLEGDSGDATIAMSFKPRIDQPLFSFIEQDRDASDWFWNFVMTTDMDGQSAGTEGEGTLRWVVNAAAGVGDEVMRLNSKGVEFGRDRRDSLAESMLPRVKMKQAEDAVGFTHLMEIEPFDTNEEGGARLYSRHNGQALQWIFNGVREDQTTPATPINKEGADATDVLMVEVYPKEQVYPFGLTVPTIRIKSFRHDETFPIDEASAVDHLVYQIENKIPVAPGFNPVNGPRLFLRDTQVQFIGNQTGGLGSGNPDPDFGVSNHLLAKTTVKAWAKWQLNSGAITLLDGINIQSSNPVIDGGTPQRLIFRLVTPLANQDNGCLIHSFGPLSSIVGQTNYVGTLFGTIVSTAPGDNIHFYFTTWDGATLTQEDWNSVTGLFSFVLLGVQ